MLSFFSTPPVDKVIKTVRGAGNVAAKISSAGFGWATFSVAWELGILEKSPLCIGLAIAFSVTIGGILGALETVKVGEDLCCAPKDPGYKEVTYEKREGPKKAQNIPGTESPVEETSFLGDSHPDYGLSKA